MPANRVPIFVAGIVGRCPIVVGNVQKKSATAWSPINDRFRKQGDDYGFIYLLILVVKLGSVDSLSTAMEQSSNSLTVSQIFFSYRFTRFMTRWRL